jgi:hypothetical protein
VVQTLHPIYPTFGPPTARQQILEKANKNSGRVSKVVEKNQLTSMHEI